MTTSNHSATPSTTPSVTPSLVSLFTDKVQTMQPYHVPKSSGMIKLDAMESPYKLPEQMRQALAAILTHVNINRYPNSSSSSLGAAIRKAFSLPAELSLMMGNGSDELIQIVLMALMRPGAKVLSPVPSFVMYQQVTELLGMSFVGVDFNPDFSLDEASFLATIAREQPAVVFLAYPNNPTGVILSRALIEKVLQTSNGFVVIDEAYSAYASDSALDLVARYENAILIRTLSKIGMAGIRLGYMLSHPSVAGFFENVRMPYNINLFTQATARFMLEQKTYLADCVNHIVAEKAALYDWLSAQAGLVVYSSETNFLLVRVDNAPEVFSRLRDDYQILVKNLDGQHPILKNILRITVGLPAENAKLKAALTEILTID
ncbi:histidinol-phosphate transaminase [Ostreibacterium oceani]|uniref:Histidinol-phosphate aminotransferase n=1 Tax=Ostreibacterium oceani TaxID=2654998 RepID=A0A6N7EXL9_9GAMM|nr:histidinol-phosphate transaminase [Ostreibacterium oceani]MPV86693.1 histidinol-phosphate transaminase [Ostreibacterium oceani]